MTDVHFDRQFSRLRGKTPRRLHSSWILKSVKLGRVTLKSKAIASMNLSSFFFAGKNGFNAFSKQKCHLRHICFVLDQSELIEEVCGFFDRLEELDQIWRRSLARSVDVGLHISPSRGA
jgi:hypothetical protein